MTDQTTPPLDLPALRRRANAATYSTWEVTPSRQTRGAWAIPGVAATVRATRSDAAHIAAFDPPTALALIARAEAAEKAVAAVRELHRPLHAGIIGEPEAMECEECVSPEDAIWRRPYPCPTITALDGTP